MTFMHILQYYLSYEISYMLSVEQLVTEDCRNFAKLGAWILWLFSALSKVIQFSDEPSGTLSEKVILYLSYSL